MVSNEYNLTIDYEDKFWRLLEEHAELIGFLQEKAPLTYQSYLVHRDGGDK